MAVLLFIDGVIRNSKNAPIPTGMQLYRTLNESNRVLFLSRDKEKDDHWLRQQKINKYDDIVGTDIPSYDGDYRQVEYVRGLGPVEMVVTPDPELAKSLLSDGVTVLVFLHPIYTDDRFRPDSIRKGFKAWAEVVAEIEKQQEVFMEDRRVED
jgi:hypothetical protein